jgi:hypothetical protein
LLRRRSFEQRLQLLTHSSFLRGCRLRAAAQQHGCSSEVLGRSPEEWWSVSVGIRIDVRACVGTSIVVELWPARQRRRCMAVRLVPSSAALAPVAIPLSWFPLHGNILCRLSIVRLGINAELLV